MSLLCTYRAQNLIELEIDKNNWNNRWRNYYAQGALYPFVCSIRIIFNYCWNSIKVSSVTAVGEWSKWTASSILKLLCWNSWNQLRTVQSEDAWFPHACTKRAWLSLYVKPIFKSYKPVVRNCSCESSKVIDWKWCITSLKEVKKNTTMHTT